MTNQVGSQYYFDANALFKYYQNEKGSLRIRRLVARTPHPILVSELTLLECFGIAVKRHRQKNNWGQSKINPNFILATILVK